jgi:short-subunit dehydrogenase
LVTIVDRDAARANLVCRNICASSGTAHYVSADLVSAAGIASVLRQLAVLPPASIVIHSAGISAVGPFAGLSLEAQQRVLDVNLRAPVQLSAAALQQGLLTPAATIVFIASLSVFTGYPGAAAYAASKDGIAAYARSMRVALASHDMHVLTIFPGPTRTAHARRYSPNNRREARRMMPERLAELIYHAVERRSNRLIPGAVNRLVALLGRIAPAASEQLMRVSIFEKLPPMGSLPADGVEPAP